MATITLRGSDVHTNGELPEVGVQAPDFTLTNHELRDVTLAEFSGKRKVLNIVPSLDTPTCQKSARQFNERALAHPDVVMINVSADLPFAQSRFCGAEGLERVVSLSMMRDKRFAEDYGVLLTDSKMAGLTARAVVVLDEQNKVLHTELVPEIAQEPDYEAALAAL